MLFLSLLLFQRKPTLIFCFPLGTADHFPVQLVFFPLLLQCLLGFGPDAGTGGLPVRLPLGSFRIGWFLFHCRVNRPAERKSTVVFQNEIPDLIFLWLSAKGDFANGQSVVLDPLKYTDPEWSFKIHGQFRKKPSFSFLRIF